MKLITKDKANEIATFQNSKENKFNEAIEYVNNLIVVESNKGNFKTSVMCSLFDCNIEIQADICNFIINELREYGYKVTKNYGGGFAEDYISISWE